MSIPMWAPFWLLAGVCAFCPRPKWMSRVDWPVAMFWVGYLGLVVVFLVFMVWVAEWMAA